jgi:hypothetical protein
VHVESSSTLNTTEINGTNKNINNNNTTTTSSNSISQVIETIQSSNYYDKKEEEKFNNNNTDLATAYENNSLHIILDAFYSDYNIDLVKLLNKYTYVPPRDVDSGVFETGGPFIDLGLVTENSKVKIKIKVLNGEANEIYLDATCRGFGSDDTEIRTFSKPLIPGLSMDLFITFTIPVGRRVNVSFIDIAVINVRNSDLNFVLNCPVFYRVDNNLKVDAMAKCTIGSLTDLLGQYCEGRTRLQKISFETKKLSGSAVWNNNKTKFLELNHLKF